MANANHVVEELRAQGRHVWRGEFVLDGVKAREKLAQFQLVDPHRYILELIQAGHLLGATRLALEVDADELSLSFEGVEPEVGWLELLYSAAFMTQRTPELRALRCLGIALCAAEGLQVRFIRVEVAAAQGLYRWELRPGQLPLVSRLGDASPPWSLKVHVREAPRLRHLRDFFSGGQPEELALLEAHAALTRVPMTLNGQDFLPDASSALWDDEDVWRFEAPGLRGALRLVWDDVHLVASVGQHGVVLVEHRWKGPLSVGAIVWVEADALNKDLSQSGFVEDEAWWSLLRLVEDKLCGALAWWLDARADDVQRSSLERAVVDAFMAAVAARHKAKLEMGAGVLALASWVEGRCLWRSADRVLGGDALVSMQALDVSLTRPDAPLRYSLAELKHVRLYPGAPQVLLKSVDQLASLRAYLGRGPAEDVTAQLMTVADVVERRRRLLYGVKYRELSASLWPWRASAAADDWCVDVGWGEVKQSSGLSCFRRVRLDAGRLDEAVLWDEHGGEGFRWSDLALFYSSSQPFYLPFVRVQLAASFVTNDAETSPDFGDESVLRLALEALTCCDEVVRARLLSADCSASTVKEVLALLAREDAPLKALSSLGCRFRVQELAAQWLNAQGAATLWALGTLASWEVRFACLGALAHVPLFETSGGALVSLSQIAARASAQTFGLWRGGEAGSPRAEVEALDVGEALYLWLDAEEAKLLNKLLWRGCFQVNERALVALMQEAQFMARPVWGAPRYEHALFFMEEDEAGCQLTLALLDEGDGERFKCMDERVAVLDVVHQDRKLCDVAFDVDFGLFLGAVSAPQLEPMSTFDGVVQDAGLSHVASWVRQRAQRLVCAWVESLEGESGALTPAARWLLWQLVVSLNGGELSAWPESVRVLLAERLASLEMFALIDGDGQRRGLTLSQLEAWAVGMAQVRTLRRGASLPDGEAACLEVFEPVAHAHRVLTSLLGLECVELWELWDEVARQEAARRHFLMRAPVELVRTSTPAGTLYSPIDHEGWRGYVLISPRALHSSPRDKRRLCWRAREARCVDVPSGWLVLDVQCVVDDAELMAFERSPSPLLAREAQILAWVDVRVLSMIAEALSCAQDDEALGRWLGCLAQLRGAAAHLKGAQSVQFQALLEDASLFRVYGERELRSWRWLRAQAGDGRRLVWSWLEQEVLSSIVEDEVILRPKTQDEAALYADCFAKTGLLGAQAWEVGRRRQVHAVPHVERGDVQVSPQFKRAVEVVAPAHPVAAERAPSPQAVIESAPREARLEPVVSRWRAAVKGCLKGQVPRIAVLGDFAGAGDSPVARVGEAEVALNEAHPLFVAWRQTPDDAWLSLMLGMCAFSAINVAEAALRDEDELEVLAWLARQEAARG